MCCLDEANEVFSSKRVILGSGITHCPCKTHFNILNSFSVSRLNGYQFLLEPKLSYFFYTRLGSSYNIITPKPILKFLSVIISSLHPNCV